MLCGHWIAATFADVADNVRNAEHAAMRRVAWREPACRAEGAPYRHLAVRVIDQAFRDLAIPTGSAAGQESAREFLAGNSMLYYWCEVADLNPVWLVARARRLMASREACAKGFREVTDTFLAEPSRRVWARSAGGMDSLNFDSEQKGQA